MSEILEIPQPLIDIHVHLREPGDNKAETIGNGSQAALLGGFAMVADMPNNPGNPTWTESKLDEKLKIAHNDAHIPIGFYAGSQPESDNVGELAKMAPKALGLKLYGSPTTGNDKEYEASDFEEIAREWHRVAPEKPILFHAGKNNLQEMVGLVAADLGHRLHVCHVNDPEDVYESILAEGKFKDRPVTSGVTPHHLIKSEHDAKSEGQFATMMPPLASQVDSEQLMNLLAGELIDIVESDYAPHTKEAKWEAEHSGGNCFGVGGIEHIFPVLLYQVSKDRLSYERLIDAMSTKPAELLGIRPGLATGTRWEMTDYRIESDNDLISGAGWSPYLGKLARGKLIGSTIRGKNIFHPVNGVRKHTYAPIVGRGVTL